ncbi:uncharacterized protein LOC124631252 [Helicoverpa zea]|uniref:uncharacterized protein LOC124631252 n=1 Tax=Helicoverpa zea TaxID=7113 RepID=UPI001F55ABF9|nr:uncharacterized protein LOC110372553 [Helicoverpa armigera]XP_047021486.1 uncharacterized protein LOC124631252 [Helicoverpa zea]
MLVAFACLLAVAAATPAFYNQHQDGDFNVQADVKNVVVLVAIPKKMPLSVFDIFSKSHKPLDKEHEIQERSDFRVMEAFVEPSTPYRVEIGSGDRSASDGRAVEVVIAGRRRLEVDAEDQDELKLLGATENCGPERIRDPETLMCQDRAPAEASVASELDKKKEDKVEPQQTPEVVVITS